MQNKQSNFKVKGIFLLCLFSLSLFSFSANKTKKTNQPNIIFILADDMSYRDLSCYGQKKYNTPNLDKLAETGIRFTEAYSAAPECAPSRCSLLTGKHTGHSSVRMNSSARGQDNLLDKDVTIAEVLKEAGYNTCFTGKWGIGLPGTEGVPYKQGFDYSFGFYDQTRAHTYIPYFLWENDQKVSYPQNKGFDMYRRYDYVGNKAQNTYDKDGKLYIEELADPYGYVYSENEIEKAAFKFLKENNPAKTQKPFFLYYATQLPHGPVIVDNIGIMAEPDSISQISREWAAMVIKLDQFVGDLVLELKESGQYENTIIFFASDNGYSMCGYTERGNGPDWPDDPWLQNKGPFVGGKFSVLEGGCRVPFFVSCPSKYNPAVYSEPVWLPDFFPTAIDLSGLEIDRFPSDGKSLLPYLMGEDNKEQLHEYLYFSKAREQAVRMGPWKAYRKNIESKTELYLIEEDTYTQCDLALIYPNIVKRAEQIMNTEYTPHPWYWNPDESYADYQKKVERAKNSNNILPVFYPNDITIFPWEKK